ncbi:MAG: hypothetical protein PHR16_07405 [Methylovulum sp.]|nr:hypothetical protein [Methylovulum sp.]
MPLYNHPEFFTNRQLDLENKLILPTRQLYNQVSWQLKTLYQAIRDLLIDVHSTVATLARQVYDQPVPTLTAWYEQAAQAGSIYYAQTEAVLMPVYHDWQIKLSAGTEKTGQYLQALWDNPKQVATTTLEPVTQYVVTAAGQSAQYLQQLLDDPELFVANALAPLSNYLSVFSEAAQATLLSSYYALAELSSQLIGQPSATLQAVYHNTLSALLEVYFEVISSLLVMA